MDRFPTIDEFQSIFLPTYTMSILGGAFVTFVWSREIHRRLGLRFPDEAAQRRGESVRWLPITMGLFERGLLTTFVLYLPSAVGPFAGTWITIKAVGGWGLFKDHSAYNRALFMTGLLGSIMSVSWAVIFGLIAKGLISN